MNPAKGMENIYWISILNKDLFISDSVTVEESGKQLFQASLNCFPTTLAFFSS